MITKITLSEIQDFLVRHLKNSSEFANVCTTILNQQLNYYKGSNIRGDIEDVPYLTAYKFNSQKTKGQDPSWVVQFVIGIDGTGAEIIDSDGVTKWEASDNVEKLAVAALDLIHEGIRDGSLLGQCQLSVVDENILVTEIGEADDVQAIVTLRLETDSIL